MKIILRLSGQKYMNDRGTHYERQGTGPNKIIIKINSGRRLNQFLGYLHPKLYFMGNGTRMNLVSEIVAR